MIVIQIKQVNREGISLVFIHFTKHLSRISTLYFGCGWGTPAQARRSLFGGGDRCARVASSFQEVTIVPPRGWYNKRTPDSIRENPIKKSPMSAYTPLLAASKHRYPSRYTLLLETLRGFTKSSIFYFLALDVRSILKYPRHYGLSTVRI